MRSSSFATVAPRGGRWGAAYGAGVGNGPSGHLGARSLVRPARAADGSAVEAHPRAPRADQPDRRRAERRRPAGSGATPLAAPRRRARRVGRARGGRPGTRITTLTPEEPGTPVAAA